MTRTVWTNEEKTAVFASMIDVFIEQPLTTNRTAMHHAQNVLVKDRRVKITDQRVHTYKARIEEAKVKAKALLARSKELAKPAPTETIATNPTPPRNDTDIGVLFTALVDRLVEQVLDKVEARMRAHVHKDVDDQFDAEYAKRNAEFRRASIDGGWLPDSAKKPRPYILVVGLLDSQASMVATQYRKQNVGMHFYTADEAKSRAIPKVDAAFLMTKFISHAAQDRVRAVVPVVKLVNSGLHSLSQEIDRFLEEGT